MGFLVVGVDGSDASRNALVWAVDLAQRLDLDVRVVHTFVPDRSELLGPAALYGATLRFAPPAPGDEGDPILATHRRLTELVDHVLGGQVPSGLDVLVVDEGRPGDVLLEQARDAELLVVGTRGQGSLSNLVFGSTAQRLTQASTCPVVVVRHQPSGNTQDPNEAG